MNNNYLKRTLKLIGFIYISFFNNRLQLQQNWHALCDYSLVGKNRSQRNLGEAVMLAGVAEIPESKIDSSFKKPYVTITSSERGIVLRVMTGKPNWFKELFLILSGLVFYLGGVLTGITITNFYR